MVVCTDLNNQAGRAGQGCPQEVGGTFKAVSNPEFCGKGRGGMCAKQMLAFEGTALQLSISSGQRLVRGRYSIETIISYFPVTEIKYAYCRKQGR